MEADSATYHTDQNWCMVLLSVRKHGLYNFILGIHKFLDGYHHFCIAPASADGPG